MSNFIVLLFLSSTLTQAVTSHAHAAEAKYQVLADYSSKAQDSSNAILQSHFKAVGQELWNQLQTVTIDGRWVDENYYGHAVKITFKVPDKIRIQGTFDGKTFVEAYDGNIAWTIAPWKRKYEVMEMNERESVIIRNSFSLGSPLYSVAENLQYEGLKDMEGTLYHAFVFEDEYLRKTFYLDRDDDRLYFEQMVAKDGAFDVLKIYEKYRTYSGLSLPTAVRFVADGLDKELVFDEVYLNLGANDSMFEMRKD